MHYFSVRFISQRKCVHKHEKDGKRWRTRSGRHPAAVRASLSRRLRAVDGVSRVLASARTHTHTHVGLSECSKVRFLFSAAESIRAHVDEQSSPFRIGPSEAAAAGVRTRASETTLRERKR